MMSDTEFDDLCKFLEPLDECYEDLDPEYRKTNKATELAQSTVAK